MLNDIQRRLIMRNMHAMCVTVNTAASALIKVVRNNKVFTSITNTSCIARQAPATVLIISEGADTRMAWRLVITRGVNGG